MRVVIASPSEDCVAHRALEQEGVPHDVLLCEGQFGYGKHLARLWGGEGFVLLEHDVVPWVGAIQQLQDCEGDWCGFRYAKGGSTIRALGCVKFSDRLARLEITEGWSREPWFSLESKVLRAVHRVTEVCKHSPALGHAKWPSP